MFEGSDIYFFLFSKEITMFEKFNTHKFAYFYYNC